MNMRRCGAATLAGALIVELGAIPRQAAAQSASSATDVRIDPGGALPPPSAYPTAGLRKTVRLHVNASEPVVVEHRLDSPAFQLVCASPCDKDVPAYGEYRVNGDGIRPTNPFELAPRAPAESLTVVPKSQPAFVGGAVLTAAGAGGLFVGLLWLLEASFVDLFGGGDNGRIFEGPLVTLAAGGVALVGGITMLVKNHYSSVVQLPTRGAGPAGPLAWPAPAWRTAERDVRPPASTVGMPLLHLSF